MSYAPLARSLRGLTASAAKPSGAALAAAVLAAALSPSAAAAPRVLAADRAAEAPEALAVRPGEPLLVEGLWLEAGAAPVALDLERIAPWAPGALVEIDGVRYPAPRGAVFRGEIRGVPGSAAIVTVGADGTTAGLVLREGEAWVLTAASEVPGALGGRRADMGASARRSLCAGERTVAPRLEPAPSSREEREAQDASAASAGRLFSAAPSHADAAHLATLALDTDFEYVAQFLEAADPAGAALDYLALLVAYADVVTTREIGTSLRIGYARLWTAGADADPWTVTDDADEALAELQAHWNAHLWHVDRSFVQLVSGKELGGGTAYRATLCQNYVRRGVSHDYGLAAGVSGGFSWDGDPASDPAAVVWDVVSVLHQLGHGFGSLHSHDDCRSGSVDPIDRCVESTQCGDPDAVIGLPACSTPTPHFDGGAGTIMSSCHLLPGGLDNIALTFGEGHTCGDQPWRQAAAMADFADARAATVAVCLAAEPPAGCAADPFEHEGEGGSNDACWGTYYEVNGGVPQAHALCDEDWVYFNPRAGATYRIETSRLTGGADTAITVQQGCGPEQAANDDLPGGGGRSRIDWTAPNGFSTDVQIVSAGAYDEDDGYTMTITCIADCGTGCTTDLALTGQIVEATQAFKAEREIVAGDGFTVGAEGDATLHAGARVVLGDGFSVAAGGRLRVQVGTTPACS